jgi:hypothetical protein
VGGVREEAENCTDKKCPLYTYRLGRDRLAKPRPPMSEAQKAASAKGIEAMKAYRAKTKGAQ